MKFEAFKSIKMKTKIDNINKLVTKNIDVIT